MNHKDERIRKLHSKGMTNEQIARKLGYGDPPKVQGLFRVMDGLERMKLTENK